MRGEVFRLLRELVEVAEDNGQLFWSLNVSAVLCHGGWQGGVPQTNQIRGPWDPMVETGRGSRSQSLGRKNPANAQWKTGLANPPWGAHDRPRNGSTKSLSAMGDEALKRHLELRLRPHGPSSWAEALAYEVTRTWAMAVRWGWPCRWFWLGHEPRWIHAIRLGSWRAEPLALLFDVMALDWRLRHHRRALTVPEKAEVHRHLAPRARGADTEELDQGALLRSGSSREILERLVWLHEQEPGLGPLELHYKGGLPSTAGAFTKVEVATTWRRSNDLDLGSLAAAPEPHAAPGLHASAAGHLPPGRRQRQPQQRAAAHAGSSWVELHPQQRLSLASSVVRAVLTSDLSSLPLEMEARRRGEIPEL
eukprot:Skav223922  [mRNA]  locus=scaffold2593:313193:316746:+ [translate_table: standard]